MPFYEYCCTSCKHQDTMLESINAARTKKCPNCGKRSLTRLISAAAFHLKGDGWYVTDFRDKKGGKGAEGDSAKGDKGGDKGDSDKGGADNGGKAAKDGDGKAAKDSNAKGGEKKNASESPAKNDGGKAADNTAVKNKQAKK